MIKVLFDYQFLDIGCACPSGDPILWRGSVGSGRVGLLLPLETQWDSAKLRSIFREYLRVFSDLMKVRM